MAPMDRRSAAAAPPPPPPMSPEPPASPSAASAASAASVLAPHETTIGRYIARFRNDKPRPREARAAVASGDFWWTLSPRFKRVQAQSPVSAASASPRRAFSFEFEDEENEEHKASHEAGSGRSRKSRAPADERSNAKPKHGDSDLYASLDELEFQVRREIGPSVAESLSSSTQSIRSPGADFAASTHSESIGVEDPEAVIQRVRQRLNWRSSPFTSRHTSSFIDEAKEVRALSPLSSSNYSDASNSFRTLRLDFDSPATRFSQQNSVERDSNTTGSPTVALSPLPIDSSSARSPLSRDHQLFELQTITPRDSPREVAPPPTYKTLQLQLDPSIRVGAPSSSTSATSIHSLSTSNIKLDAHISSRSKYTLPAEDTLDADIGGSESPTLAPPCLQSDQTGSRQNSTKSPCNQHVPDQNLYDASQVTQTSEGIDSLQTPREMTPPRATPPLPPAHMDSLTSTPSTSRSATPHQKSPIQDDESPRTAAEQVLNTLVGFVVHSWGEEATPKSNAAGGGFVDATVRPVQSSPILHNEVKSFTSQESAEQDNIPLAISDGSSEHESELHTVIAENLSGEEVSAIEDDLGSDEDYAIDGETDEMTLLLVERIAIFKEALHRLEEREQVTSTD